MTFFGKKLAALLSLTTRSRPPGSCSQEKLTPLLRLKYHNSISDVLADLGQAEEIGQVFAGLQKYLYQPQTVA
jgi:hypothetical protein